MSNFAFLKGEWPEIQPEAARAEALALTDPRGACFYARRTLELAVHWVYAHDATLSAPYDTGLAARIHDAAFRRLVPGDVFPKMRVIKDLGNEAVHSQRAVEERESGQAVRELFHVLYWLARTYTRQGAGGFAGLQWDPAHLSAGAKRAAARRKSTAAELLQRQEELEERDRRLAEQAEELLRTRQSAEELDAELRRLRAEIAAAKKANEAVPDAHDYSEAETRDFIIDLLLREAGWPLQEGRDREFRVEGMPRREGGVGAGVVDYVLWGDDGLPLGVVEAKRTKRDPHAGQHQAKLYADCLQQKYGQRPAIFYTNGYEIWFWDDLRYPPRQVQGFYQKEELQLLVQRRASRKPLKGARIDPAIVERPYQVEAIRRFTEELEQHRRKALAVMATGSGKTRTVIALCDLLQRCNWVKRVLFLADRRALVRQAANAFKTHLPGCSPVNLLDEREDTGSRVLLSTYPTMMRLVDEMKGGERRFGPGHFDLLVIDEAHRSVYQKYGALFEYFDGMLVGLTATPKDEVDKNTYRLFELENGVPTFAYELSQAVRDGYLVPPRSVSVPLKFQRQGIRYDELSEEEQEQWETLDWDEEGGIPDQVDAAAVNQWLFNEDTVDKVLAHLMTHGLRVDGGDRLGKTIIFARNHEHAVFIQKRFDRNYPQYLGAFARVIDHKTERAEHLLDEFSTPDRAPHIAISVDMLDTGIDIPEVVNLVFFKLVRSRTKFWQMIGRGTRLCKDLLGPGQDKECFYLFDFCQNLEFFNENPEGTEGGLQPTLGERLFRRRLELLQHLQEPAATPPADRVSDTRGTYTVSEEPDLQTELADRLHAEVAAMNPENFLVRPQRRHVEAYRERAAWDQLSPAQADEIKERLAGLPSQLPAEDVTARQFDLLLLHLQLGYLQPTPLLPKLRERVRKIAGQLDRKHDIPQVRAQLDLIQEVQGDPFWEHVTLAELERVRKRLRELVRFIEKRERKVVYSTFEDEIGAGTEVVFGSLASSIDAAQYRKKVTQLLVAHREHPAVLKVRFNEPLTPEDLRSLEDLLHRLDAEAGDERLREVVGQESLGAFIRKLVGLDREAAQRAFGRHLAETPYTAAQIRFIDQIIEYLTRNGVMDPVLLYRQPFTDFHPNGVDGLFTDDEADRIVRIIAEINRNAGLSAEV